MKTTMGLLVSLVLVSISHASVSPMGVLSCTVVDFNESKVRLNCGTAKQPNIVSVPKSYFNQKFDLRPDAKVSVKRRTEDLVRDIASASPQKGKVK